MNGSFFPNPTYPGADNNYQIPTPSHLTKPNNEDTNTRNVGISNIESVLRVNIGKKVHVFASFKNSNEWHDKEFNGVIEDAFSDHLILSNNETGEWYLIPMKHLDYVAFNERIIHNQTY